MIIKPADYAELVEKLEESQMNLSSMATNRYSKPFESTVSEWLIKLGTVSEIMEQWFQVQVRARCCPDLLPPRLRIALVSTGVPR